MQNYLQPGDTITLVAPYNVASGAGLLVGKLFGVAAYTALSGADVEAKTRGVFELPKTSAQAWTQGADLYWDDTNKVCTTTSSGNTLIGKAAKAAANPSATGFIRLNG